MGKAKMETRNEILNRRMEGYSKAGRKGKSLTLTELEKNTGLSRNHTQVSAKENGKASLGKKRR